MGFRRTALRPLSVTGHFAADCSPFCAASRSVSPAKRSGGIGKSSPDRRVRRTRGVLHEALFQLIHEREYHRISVRLILQRANVGRSTFYAHFDDKDALLASAVGELLKSVLAAGAATPRAPEAIVGFGRPFFEHIERARSLRAKPMGQRSRALLHDKVRRILTQSIAEEMGRQATGLPGPADCLPAELAAQHVAATFMLVLEWWIDHGCTGSSAEADALFRSLVLPVLDSSAMLTVGSRPPRSQS